MMAHNTTVQLGGTAFLVCKVAGVDRVGVNWVCFGVLCIFLCLYIRSFLETSIKLESLFAYHLSALIELFSVNKVLSTVIACHIIQKLLKVLTILWYTHDEENSSGFIKQGFLGPKKAACM